VLVSNIDVDDLSCTLNKIDNRLNVDTGLFDYHGYIDQFMKIMAGIK